MEHIQRIQAQFPDLTLSELEINTEGLVNDVIIVNRTRVFRFPKSDWAKKALAAEIKILEVVQQHVDMRVPHFDYRAEDMVAYDLIQGKPLYRHELLLMDKVSQDKILEQLTTFLLQLHTIPNLEKYEIPRSDARSTREEWLKLYEEIQAELFPLMFKTTREVTHQHFEILEKNEHFLDFAPCLIHADLAQYHILVDETGQKINGIIDFGTAGIGDPALDIGVLLNVYGESVVRKMADFYPQITEMIGRARFYAGMLEFQWVLGGLRSKDFSWFTAHLDRARDMKPIGSGF